MSILSCLIERLEGGETGNALDVLIEVALFKPGRAYRAIRANAAGTKVIYTDKAGNDVTCWAEDWTTARRLRGTIRTLKAKAGTA